MKVVSIMEVIDTVTMERRVLFEKEGRFEAPNWHKDGFLVYNMDGRLFTYHPETDEHGTIDTGFCDRCNNDHVLSADGTRVAVSHNGEADGQSRIYVLPIGGGTPVKITENAPSYLHGWSPDGKTLCYCANRGGNYDVYTISVTGGDETRLTDAPGLDDGPEYSPCGQYIWFNSVRTGLMQVFRMDADGQNQTPMTHHTDKNSWFPHVSPDGKKVLYIAYHKGDVEPGDHPADKNVELRLMDADGQNDRLLTALFGGQGTLNVNAWAPDSRRAAFVSYRIEA